MIHLNNIEKYFADRPIFGGINWHIRPNEKIGLCGENGAGKTTLLKFLAGQIEQDKGDIHTAKGVQVGYLPQEGLEHAGRSLFDEVRSSLDNLLDMERRLGELETVISKTHNQSDMDTYAELQEQFRYLGGYEMEAEIGKVLQGLGFHKDEWSKACEHFSGGWQMRIALAKLLLKRPELLLLDEPTNHLDLPARDWLEGYLANYPFTVVLVSHDRFFLDQVVTRIVEIWNGLLTSYPGSYSHYLKARDEQIAALHAAKERQDDEIDKMESFINKFRYNANKASLVQSRIKQLDKIVRIAVPPKRKKIGFSFPPPPKGGRLVLQLTGVEQGYDNKTVLRNVDLTIEKGERIALVGANGAGKSTLMRILSGEELPLSGVREEGHNLSFAYFAQDQAKTLNQDKTVLQEITDSAPFDMVPKVRNILGSFLFSGDDVDKRVSVLSGGERNRLALAILLLRPANLLLLDEPTNHLDLLSKEVLLEALKSYAGTLVFVSHDRYFVDNLAERIIHIDQTAATSHLGNYGYFLSKMDDQGDNTHSSLRVESNQNNSTGDGQKKVAGKDQYRQSKEEKRQRKKLEKICSQLEENIAAKEEELATLETQMASADFAAQADKWREATKSYEGLKDELETLYNDWEETQLALNS